MDPLARFKADRDRARAQQDPMANLCTVGNQGEATTELRTLVLRDVGDELAIFINATSPKWSALQQNAGVLTYWPSIQVQYRMSVDTKHVAEAIVAESWQLRPDAPKQMDWFYTTVQSQSSAIGTREDLLAQTNAMTLKEPLVAPETAQGLILTPYKIERLDLTQENGIHDRTSYEFKDGAWTETTLVP